MTTCMMGVLNVSSSTLSDFIRLSAVCVNKLQQTDIISNCIITTKCNDKATQTVFNVQQHSSCTAQSSFFTERTVTPETVCLLTQTFHHFQVLLGRLTKWI